MCKAHYVADFFIDVALHDPEIHMTNMRINKLMYFAQGWSLARYNKPLFKAEIQAWDYGPVVPPIYHRLKTSGRDKIKGVMDEDYADHFTPEESQLLMDIQRTYNVYSTNGLVILTHKKGTPWSDAYAKGKGTAIPLEAMKTYFKKEKPLSVFHLPKFTAKDFVGYRDKETGYYVLPKELDDEYET